MSRQRQHGCPPGFQIGLWMQEVLQTKSCCFSFSQTSDVVSTNPVLLLAPVSPTAGSEGMGKQGRLGLQRKCGAHHRRARNHLKELSIGKCCAPLCFFSFLLLLLLVFFLI